MKRNNFFTQTQTQADLKTSMKSPVRMKSPNQGQLIQSLQYNKLDLKTDVICHKKNHNNSFIVYLCLEH
jgi:hypothetical protein